MPNLPSGTVTFLFSDIEEQHRLLKQLGHAAYTELLAQHRRLVRAAFASHDGQEIDTQGDAFFYSFPRARQAPAAASCTSRMPRPLPRARERVEERVALRVDLLPVVEAKAARTSRRCWQGGPRRPCRPAA